MAATVRELQRRGQQLQQPALSKWGFASESAGTLRAAISLAKDLPDLQADVTALDADPWLLCAPNGVIDHRSGAVREHQRDDLITKVTHTAYDPAARAPRFVQLLGEVFRGDWELAQYVPRYLGYALTRSVREQVFQVWHGHGANGKSTLLEAVRCVMWDYAQTLSGDLVLERRTTRASEAASRDIARLRGARLAAGVETKPNQRWNESLVKRQAADRPRSSRRAAPLRRAHRVRADVEADPWREPQGMRSANRVVMVVG